MEHYFRHFIEKSKPFQAKFGTHRPYNYYYQQSKGPFLTASSLRPPLVNPEKRGIS